MADFGFHIDQDIAMIILIAAAIQKFVAKPAELLLIQPPTIPPTKMDTTAAHLRFLFTLSFASI